jgi:hypothetical protein
MKHLLVKLQKRKITRYSGGQSLPSNILFAGSNRPPACVKSETKEYRGLSK